MNFRIEKRVGIQATSERIWSVLTNLASWSTWNPVETEASGTIAFGGQITLTEVLTGLPARPVVAQVGDWQPLAQLVWTEKRGLMFNVVRYYEIDELEPGSCIVANGYIFGGMRGEGFHDKHRLALRHACAAVGDALKATAENQAASDQEAS